MLNCKADPGGNEFNERFSMGPESEKGPFPCFEYDSAKSIYEVFTLYYEQSSDELAMLVFNPATLKGGGELCLPVLFSHY